MKILAINLPPTITRFTFIFTFTMSIRRIYVVSKCKKWHLFVKKSGAKITCAPFTFQLVNVFGGKLES